MLRKMSIRKIIISSLTLFVLLLIYLIPSNKEEGKTLNINQKLDYVYTNNLEVIYLLDSNDYVSKTNIGGCKCDDLVEKSSYLIESLTIDGKKSDIIPNGFKSVIPSGTKVLNISLENGILKIDFSKEFLDVNKKYEEKMIESLTYTLTSIDGINGLIIYVEGKPLTKLPNSKKNIPTFLDKNYGVNKVYDISNTKNIDSYTIYYLSEFNDNYYYVPVTKYINNTNQDKVKIIIEELTSAPIYESNLMSFLNVSTKLLNYEINDNTIKLNFNNMILSDITGSSILEEVLYTISMSIQENYDVKEVIFLVENEEITKIVTKDIE